MMCGSRILLVLFLALQISAETQGPDSVTVTEGEDVTLFCKNLIPDQPQCHYTSWEFHSYSETKASHLFEYGQKKTDLTAVRLSQSCSLVLQKVTVKQTGAYVCRQFNREEGDESTTPLFVVAQQTVTEGEEVSLTCEKKISPQPQCEHTNWNFSNISGQTTELFQYGKKNENNVVSSGVSLSQDCSLVLKNITVKEAGVYFCQQFIQNDQQGNNTIELSVVTLTKDKNSDTVTFSCSVSSYGPCKHSVKWLNNNEEVNKHQQLQCGAAVFVQEYKWPQEKTSQFDQSLQCEVTERFGQKKKLILRPLSLDKNQDERDENKKDNTRTQGLLVRHVVLSLSLAALLVCVAVVLVWSRTKGLRAKRNQTNEDPGELTVEYENLREPSVCVRVHTDL